MFLKAEINDDEVQIDFKFPGIFFFYYFCLQDVMIVLPELMQKIILNPGQDCLPFYHRIAQVYYLLIPWQKA